MAEEQPGAATGGHVRVAIQDLGQAGQQFRAQAQNLNVQVISPLNDVESSHGVTWQSGSHGAYLRLHKGLVASLGHVQQATHRMGATMEQSAGAYSVLNQTRFNGAPGLPGDGSDPFDTIRVAGQAKPPTLAEVQALQNKYPGKVNARALTPDEARSLQQSEDARLRAMSAADRAPSDMKGKCWAADETKKDPLVWDSEDDEDPVPSGFKSPRPPYPQLTPDVAQYTQKLSPYGYTLRPNSALDTFIDENGAVQGAPGFFNASHAEKQASMRGDFGFGQSKRIGINIGQCRDCRQYFWATAQERGAAQFVTDPYVSRIYYPNGDVGIVFDPVGQEGQQAVYVIDRDIAQAGLFKSGRLP